LVPQLRDAAAPRPWPAITTANQNNHSIRTDRWRYIRYADGSEELYDLQNDPNEWHNLAQKPAHAQTKTELAQWLPKTNLPSADPAGQRVLTFNPATGALTWEGKSVNPGDPVPDDH
jgi:arylsulfatase A-like enzyme